MGSLFEVPLHLAVILTLAADGSESGRKSLSAHAAPLPVSAAISRMSEQDWLSAVENGAGGDDLAAVRAAIFKTSSGRYYVAAEAQRVRLPALRKDGRLSALVAYDMARKTAAALRRKIGRAASAKELYMAEVVGVDAAAGLIAVAETMPDAAIGTLLPGVAETIAADTTVRPAPVTAPALWRRLDGAFSPDVERIAAAALAAMPPLAVAGLKGTDTTDAASPATADAPLAWNGSRRNP